MIINYGIVNIYIKKYGKIDILYVDMERFLR